MTSAAVSEVCKADVPVLCFDTCSLLDVMRAPTRDDIQVDEREACVSLLNRAEHHRQLISLIATPVYDEINYHKEKIHVENGESVKNLQTQMRKVDALHRVFGGSGAASVYHLDEHSFLARSYFDRWMAVQNHVTPDADAEQRADLRVANRRAPSALRKESRNDCMIVETYLGFASTLRDSSFNKGIVFVSSNTKEYMNSGIETKQEIIEDFSYVRMQYARNFTSALQWLQEQS